MLKYFYLLYIFTRQQVKCDVFQMHLVFIWQQSLCSADTTSAYPIHVQIRPSFSLLPSELACCACSELLTPIWWEGMKQSLHWLGSRSTPKFTVYLMFMLFSVQSLLPQWWGGATKAGRGGVTQEGWGGVTWEGWGGAPQAGATQTETTSLG